MKENKQTKTKISCEAILLCSVPSQETTGNGRFVPLAMVADLQVKSVKNLGTGIPASLRTLRCIFHENYFAGTASSHYGTLRRK